MGSAPEVIFEREFKTTAPNPSSTAADMLKLDQLLIDDAEDVRRRKREQEAADKEFARRMQEEEKRKSQTLAAASAHRLPEVDRQMDRLKKDATDLKQANAAQQQRQDDEVWYTKTTKRHSPVKVGGQYVSIIPP